VWTLIGYGVIALALLGAWQAHDHNQRVKGAAEVRAQMAEAEAAKQARIAKVEEKARLELTAILTDKDARNKAKDKKLSELQTQRAALSDTLAASDRAYALWRDERVPDVVERGLRDYAAALTGSGTGGVPTGTGVSPATQISDTRGRQ
jgi:hypothetical protein